MREIGYAICATLVVTAVFSMLLPRPDHNKTVQFAVQLFLLLSVVLAVTRQNFDFSFALSEYQAKQQEISGSLSSLAQQQVLKSLETQLCQQADQILKNNGISAREIVFSIHIREDNRIDITSLTLVLGAEDWNHCDDAVAEINRTFALTAIVRQEETASGS